LAKWDEQCFCTATALSRPCRRWGQTQTFHVGSMSALPPDCVAKLFFLIGRVRLIQYRASMRNVDSRIHSHRFDCCVFLFYSFSTVTFATQSSNKQTSIGAAGRSA